MVSILLFGMVFQIIITYNKVNNGCKSAILNLIELTFLSAYTSLKPYISFYSNGLAILHGLPDIMHIKVGQFKSI